MKKTLLMARRRVAVAMSGGVDSSVAAHLLQQESSGSLDLIGLHMSNWDPQDEDDQQSGVCHEQDATDAQAVCDFLHIPLHRASFAADYWTGVFEPFVEGIAQGRTPNPDVSCNRVVKFGAMRTYAHQRLAADALATGHYARLWDRSASTPPSYIQELWEHHADLYDWLPSWGTDPTTPLLLAGADLAKDQSYFLSSVDGSAFRNVLFPLGDLYKTTTTTTCSTETTSTENSPSVRELAAAAHLPTAQKRDSMGICFIGRRQFSQFIAQYLPEPPAPHNFVDIDTGAVVGPCPPSALYATYGQGAKIGGAPQKWFVAGRDGTTVWVCGGTHHAALYSCEATLKNVHWVGGGPPPPAVRGKRRFRAQCRSRHLQPLVGCDLVFDVELGTWKVHFDKPVRAVTPGQMCVFYVGNGLVCLGGGPIEERGPTFHELGVDLPPLQDLHPAGLNDRSVPP